MRFTFLHVVSLVLISSSAFDPIALAKSEGFSVTAVKTDERKDRIVDRAAVAMQAQAIKGIEKLLNSRRWPSDREANLTFQLATARLDTAAIRFRISHEESHTKGKALDLSSYTREMKAAIATLTRFLDRFPKENRRHEALYMRGSAYAEAEDKKNAQKDFLKLVRDFPESSHSSAAYMKLADFAIEDENHKKALKYLRPLESRPKDPYHPFALYKAAWAHFNLSNFDTSLSFLAKQIRFYDEKFARQSELDTSEEAIRQNSLRDVAVFFFEGLQKRRAGFTVDTALGRFEKVSGESPIDEISTRFTRLLRTDNNPEQLNRWAKIVEKSQLNAEVRMSIYLTLLENQMNRRQYSNISKNLQRVARVITEQENIREKEVFTELKTTVEKGAKDLRDVILANKKAKEAPLYAVHLENMYSLLRKADPTDQYNTRAGYFNLGETYFQLASFAKSTQFYTSAIETFQAGEQLEDKNGKSTEYTDEEIALRMRRLASRFEELRARKIFPEKLTVVDLRASQVEKKAAPIFVEWKKWLAESGEIGKLKKEDALVLSRYHWEAQRVDYNSGKASDVMVAISSEIQLLKSVDDLQEPKVTLALDTYVKSEQWNELNVLAKDLISKTDIQSDSLQKKLVRLEADSFLKNVEKAFSSGNSQLASEQLGTCFMDYKEQPEQLESCRMIEIEQAYKVGDFEKVVNVSPTALENFQINKNIARTFELFEDSLVRRKQYGEALKLIVDHSSSAEFQKTSKQRQKERWSRALEWAVIDGSMSSYQTLTKKTAFCKHKAEDCRMLTALASVHGDSEAPRFTYSELFKAHKPYRSLYSLIAVRKFQTSLADRMKVFRNTFSNWKHIDSQIYWAVLPHINNWVEAEMKENRRLLTRNYPIKASNLQSLANRVKRLADFQKSVQTVATSIPLSTVEIHMLAGIKGAYTDLSREIRDELGEDGNNFQEGISQKIAEITSKLQTLEVTGTDELLQKLTHLDALARSNRDGQFENALSSNQWVLAKLIQSELQDEKVGRQQNMFRSYVMDAKIFMKLGAFREMATALEKAETVSQQILVGQTGGAGL